MQPVHDTWTHAHDLTLVFLALAYSSDATLTDSEVDSIAEALQRWRPDASRDEIHEIVLEATAAFLESDAEEEVLRSVRTLGEALSLEKRRQALEDAMRIAEADGILLNSEQNILSIIAAVWDIRATKERLLRETLVDIEEHPEWSVLHDIAFLFIVMAHGADGELLESEITVMVDRLSRWSPDLNEDGIRAVLRSALEYYAGGPESFDLEATIESVSDTLPRAQRLVVLDDLMAIAEADAPIRGEERDILETLSAAWRVDVRLSHGA